MKNFTFLDPRKQRRTNPPRGTIYPDGQMVFNQSAMELMNFGAGQAYAVLVQDYHTDHKLFLVRFSRTDKGPPLAPLVRRAQIFYLAMRGVMVQLRVPYQHMRVFYDITVSEKPFVDESGCERDMYILTQQPITQRRET